MSELIPSEETSGETWRVVLVIKGLGKAAAGALSFEASFTPDILGEHDEMFVEPISGSDNHNIDWELHGRNDQAALFHAVDSTLRLSAGLEPGTQVEIVDAQAGRIDGLDPEERYDWRSLSDFTEEARDTVRLLASSQGVFDSLNADDFR